MWKWIKKLFTPKKQQYEEIHIDYSKSLTGTTSPTIDATLDSTITAGGTGNFFMLF